MGKDFITYTYLTDITKVDGQDQVLRKDQIVDAFRQAVLGVFRYYGKSRTWTVSGNVSFGTAGNQIKIKKAHTDVLVRQNRLGILESSIGFRRKPNSRSQSCLGRR